MGVWLPPSAAARRWARGGPSSDKSNDEPAGRIPAPAPRPVLSADDREVWAPAPPDRAVVPVLLYHGVAPVSGFSRRADADLGIDPEDFARHIVLLHHAGYQTITLDEFVRFKRESVNLPPRPFLLTFDGGRVDSWTGSDGILRLGFNAALFVDVGRVEAAIPNTSARASSTRLQRGGRWDVQLQSGTGKQLIRYGPGPDEWPLLRLSGGGGDPRRLARRGLRGHPPGPSNSSPSVSAASDRSRSRPRTASIARPAPTTSGSRASP